MIAIFSSLLLLLFNAGQRERANVDATFMAEEINEYRVSVGRKPLQYDSTFQRKAERWAITITDRSKYAHAKCNCYDSENLAIIRRKEDIVQAWKDSPGHNRNLLSKNINYMTVAVHYQDGYYHAVFRGYIDKGKVQR